MPADVRGVEQAADQHQHVVFKQYEGESDLQVVMSLIDNELSEPYSIFTYRYFLHTWPHLCFMAYDEATAQCVGCVVGKLDLHRGRRLRGYIAMLTVQPPYRHLGIGSQLVERTIHEMVAGGGQEVALEAEVTNLGALRLYENLGFIRDKRLQRYYLNGNDAYRLKLLLPNGEDDAGYGSRPFPEDTLHEVHGAAEALQALSVG